jgi:hypothetical protein
MILLLIPHFFDSQPIMPWHQVTQAHQRLEQGGTRGKIVLQFTEN